MESDRRNEYRAMIDEAGRDAVALLLREAFTCGVHTALVVLHEHEIPPFDDGYEGTRFQDFMGRLILPDWEWPE